MIEINTMFTEELQETRAAMDAELKTRGKDQSRGET